MSTQRDYKKGRRYRRKNKRVFNRRQAMAVKALAVSAVKADLKPELKHSDQTQNYTGCDGSGGFAAVPILLTTISQGVDDTTHIGDRLNLKSLLFNFSLNMWGYNFITTPGTPSYAETVCRVILFQWQASNTDDVPSTAKILQLTGTTRTDILAPYHIDRGSRFRIIYDETMSFSKPDKTHFEGQVRVKFNTKGIKNVIEFQQGSSNSGINHVYAVFLMDDDMATGADAAHYRFKKRVRYMDV